MRSTCDELTLARSGSQVMGSLRAPMHSPGEYFFSGPLGAKHIGGRGKRRECVKGA
jgi:hypothetical protein